MDKARIGVLGAGAISGIYFKNLTTVFEETKVEAVCDICREKAEAAAKEYGIEKIYDTLEEMLADENVEIILNLTRPKEHYETTKKALLAGKHVYSEKPLAETYEEGKELAELAKDRGLLLGGAPDTFLGAGIRTCKKLIEDGFIGRVIGAEARMICRGHESWHPAPEFYYQKGGGPMMDMGPYYMTALVHLIGGVQGVSGMTGKSFEQRLITSQPKKGTKIDVEVPTYYGGLMRFENGAIGNVTMTFDVHYDSQAFLEIYGTEGTLRVPDPNTFDGGIKLLRPEEGVFREMPLLFPYRENSRGLGLAQMARALRDKGEFPANVNLTLHVLEILTAFEKSSTQGRYLELESRYRDEKS